MSVAGGAGVFPGSNVPKEDYLASGGGGVLKITTGARNDIRNFIVSGGDLQVKRLLSPRVCVVFCGA